ncbi:MAG: DUF4179 domain-containing protein [Clostridia bacterium]|nr:DUF4179 domain-containing protein [Clostridia bacterium]
MKKKISAALVLCIIVGLSIIGTAYALSSSQVAEFFGLHWNQELGESLKEGKIAQIGESVTVGDVVFTLDEIVYKDRALYGVGTARPVHENDVIIPMDLAEDLEYFAQNEEARALVEKAKASGGRMFTTDSMPTKIGVDEGTMLMPGCIGYYDIANEDGSVTFSFEASDGFAVNEGVSYQIMMESWVWQMNENGEKMDGTRVQGDWTVSCIPTVLNPSAEKTEMSPVSVIEQDGYELVVPEAYRETGTLPVYRAVEADFTKTVNPEWFNGTGTKDGADTLDIRLKDDRDVLFADNARLSLSPEALFYNEYADEAYAKADSGVIVELIWMRKWENHRGEFTLEKTELSGIALSEAQAQAEALMEKLGMACNQYVCDEALDMSLERIQTMGAIWEKAIADGELLVDDDYQPYDYSAIPASEEGYYLHYSPLGVEMTAAGGRYGAIFYVNGRGIVYANIRNQFNRGEIVTAPETLIAPDAAIQTLAEEMGHSLSRHDEEIKAVQQVALTYEAVRAENKSDGMVFVPTWMILYQDTSAVRQGYSCYALINAVDGTLIDATFR